MKKTLTIREFHQRFQTHEDCYKYLCKKKWGKGFTCRRCGHTKYTTGRKQLWRKCTKCLYNESPTCNTLFHKLKFDIRDAFYMVYRISTDKKGVSSMELHRETGIRQKTCWYFKRKVQEAMKLDESDMLSGTVEVDECLIGGPEESKQGRSSTSKKHKVLVMLQHVTDKKGRLKMGNAYAQKINGYSANDLSKAMNGRIQSESLISTDKWTGYTPLAKEFSNLYQTKSDRGQNFPLIHLHIMNVKNWLRGIHHHCSANHLQAYMNEYHYRFNNRNRSSRLFSNIISAMVASMPLYMSLKEVCA